MKGDFSRDTFRAHRHYTGVLMQQGRTLVDADWNEQLSILLHHQRSLAGFTLDWQTLTAWRRRGIELATITHAAGISSTGDADLDEQLPFDEAYIIPEYTSNAIAETKAQGGSIIAIGTTVVRALESAATMDGIVPAGHGVARGRIGPKTQIRVINTVLSGTHEPGESHFELLRAFADDPVLLSAHRTATERNYRTHEFGDSVLIERREAA